LSSLKPPFAAPAEYHRFSDPRVGAADHGAEAIVVKSPVSSSYFCFGKIYAFIFE
jgi:hypothetical protein